MQVQTQKYIHTHSLRSCLLCQQHCLLNKDILTESRIPSYGSDLILLHFMCRKDNYFIQMLQIPYLHINPCMKHSTRNAIYEDSFCQTTVFQDICEINVRLTFEHAEDHKTCFMVH